MGKPFGVSAAHKRDRFMTGRNRCAGLWLERNPDLGVTLTCGACKRSHASIMPVPPAGSAVAAEPKLERRCNPLPGISAETERRRRPTPILSET